MISRPAQAKLIKAWDSALDQILFYLTGKKNKLSPPAATKRLEMESNRRLIPSKKCQFIIITGPSGVGRSTIGKELKKMGIPGIRHYTTRPPRSEAEKKSGDYRYITREAFFRLRKKGEFLQDAETYGQWRGISKAEFSALIRKKKKFYIDKSLWTAKKMMAKKELKNKTYLKIFILPPSFKELLNRLFKRTISDGKSGRKEETKTLTQGEVLERLSKGIRMLKESQGLYDVYLVNDQIPRIVKRIRQYI